MDYLLNSNYDFLRRHYPYQVKGSKFDYFLSACQYKLPLHFQLEIKTGDT